jgi:hypothetical protein
MYEDDEGEGTNLYAKTAGLAAGDLNQDKEQRRIERSHQKLHDRYMAGWAVEDLVNDSEDENVVDSKPQLIDSDGGTYEDSPTNEAEIPKAH